MPGKKKLLTAQDVAEVLGLSVETIWRYTREKKIPYLELGKRQYRYILSDVIEALNLSQVVQEEKKPYSKENKKVFTYTDYLALPSETGYRFEVLDGELIKEPSPNVMHQRVSRRLHRLLEDYFQQVDPQGEVFCAPLDVTWCDINVVQPDLFYIPGEQKNMIAKTHIKGAPQLIVEILSPHNQGKDRIIKMQMYQKAGVKHYWIVDPEENSLECYSLQNQVYSLIATGLGENEVEHTDFPGLSIPLKDLWAKG